MSKIASLEEFFHWEAYNHNRSSSLTYRKKKRQQRRGFEKAGSYTHPMLILVLRRTYLILGLTNVYH